MSDPIETEPGRPTVLVVDDDEGVRRVAMRILERAGYTVLQAKDGREAITHVEVHGATIGAVLLDLSMPIMSGEQTRAELRRIDATLPILFMSGFTQQDALDSSSDPSIAGFVPKPFRPHQLIEAVAAALRTAD